MARYLQLLVHSEFACNRCWNVFAELRPDGLNWQLLRHSAMNAQVSLLSSHQYLGSCVARQVDKMPLPIW